MHTSCYLGLRLTLCYCLIFQEVLNCDGSSAEPLSIMYGSLLRNYEEVKEEYSHVRKRYDDLAASHSAAVAKLEHSQVGQHFFHHI